VNELEEKSKKELLLTKTWVAAFLALICSALWGSAFSGVKIGYEKFGIDASRWQDQLVLRGFVFLLQELWRLLSAVLQKRRFLYQRRKRFRKL